MVIASYGKWWRLDELPLACSFLMRDAQGRHADGAWCKRLWCLMQEVVVLDARGCLGLCAEVTVVQMCLCWCVPDGRSRYMVDFWYVCVSVLETARWLCMVTDVTTTSLPASEWARVLMKRVFVHESLTDIAVTICEVDYFGLCYKVSYGRCMAAYLVFQ